MGFEGAKPFCESLSTFFSEESRGPSRPERQVKSILRGKSEAGKGERQERKAVHTRRTAGKAQKRQSNTQAGKQRHRMRAHLRETSRTAAGAAAPPCPRRSKPNRPNSGSKSPAHTAPAEKLTGQQNGTQKAGQKGTTAAGRAKTTSPPHGAARRAQKNPSEQAKLAFALLPARRGFVKRGRQKIASLFLAGTIFLASRFYLLRIACSAARSAEQKGAPPPFIPCKLFEKSLTKNFIVWAG